MTDILSVEYKVRRFPQATDSGGFAERELDIEKFYPNLKRLTLACLA